MRYKCIACVKYKDKCVITLIYSVKVLIEIQNKSVLNVYAVANGQLLFFMFVIKFRIDGTIPISFHVHYILLCIVCYNIQHCNVS